MESELYLLVAVVNYDVDLSQNLLEFIAFPRNVRIVRFLKTASIAPVLLVHFEDALQIYYLVKHILIAYLIFVVGGAGEGVGVAEWCFYVLFYSARR